MKPLLYQCIQHPALLTSFEHNNIIKSYKITFDSQALCTICYLDYGPQMMGTPIAMVPLYVILVGILILIRPTHWVFTSDSKTISCTKVRFGVWTGARSLVSTIFKPSPRFSTRQVRYMSLHGSSRRLSPGCTGGWWCCHGNASAGRLAHGDVCDSALPSALVKVHRGPLVLSWDVIGQLDHARSYMELLCVVFLGGNMVQIAVEHLKFRMFVFGRRLKSTTWDSHGFAVKQPVGLGMTAQIFTFECICLPGVGRVCPPGIGRVSPKSSILGPADLLRVSNNMACLKPIGCSWLPHATNFLRLGT